jgi:hypothetical protein
VKPALLLTTVVFTAATTFAQQANIHPPDLGAHQQQDSQALPSQETQSVLGSGASLRLNAIDPMIVSSDKRPIDDTVCYTIRSYVVARDSKHSDSVHPAGYSTCQPAGKYRLRTTQLTTDPAER